MGKRVTAEEFILRANAKHGGKFDYTRAVLSGVMVKIEIICPLHGSFWQTPNSHVGGKGCPHCSGNARLTKDTCISRFKGVHGDTYDYSKVEYQSSESKVIITCKLHGDFEQTPVAHFKLKQGCAKCYRERQGAWKKSTSEEFTKKAVAAHGDRYDYSEVEYVQSHLPVTIKCNGCGEAFSQSPNAHLSGKGCRTCNLSGFTFSRSAYLYVLGCGNVTKVGITNKTPQSRATDVSRSSGQDFKVVATFHMAKGRDALALESTMLKLLRARYDSPTERFNGYTECFVDVDVPDLLQEIGNRLTGIDLVQ